MHHQSRSNGGEKLGQRSNPAPDLKLPPRGRMRTTCRSIELISALKQALAFRLRCLRVALTPTRRLGRILSAPRGVGLNCSQKRERPDVRHLDSVIRPKLQNSGG
jgi:hypothetical protein